MHCALLVPLLFLHSMLAAPAASAVEAELLSLPDAQRASIYQTNAATVDELRAIILDSKRPAFEREAAMRRLRSRFSEAAINTALELVNDPSDEISGAAANILASSIVMTDHSHSHGQGVTPLQAYWQDKHNAARTALRKLLAGPNRPARDVAARILMSLSDELSFQIINEGARKGAYSEAEAVNYFGLANPDVGASYMIPYLDSRNPSAQSAAGAYLASRPPTQGVVREKVFANSDASPLARATASKVLSQYDPAYTSYAPNVARRPGIPEVVEESVVEGVLRNWQIKKETKKDSPGEKAGVAEFLSDFGAKNPKYNVYRERLDRM